MELITLVVSPLLWITAYKRRKKGNDSSKNIQQNSKKRSKPLQADTDPTKHWYRKEDAIILRNAGAAE